MKCLNDLNGDLAQKFLTQTLVVPILVHPHFHVNYDDQSHFHVYYADQPQVGPYHRL